MWSHVRHWALAFIAALVLIVMSAPVYFGVELFTNSTFPQWALWTTWGVLMLLVAAVAVMTAPRHHDF